jgi:hypothetical protein
VTSTPESPPEASDRGATAVSFDLIRGESITAAILFFVGLFFVWHASSLHFGDLAQPGPGFVPLVLGALLMGLSAMTGALLSPWRSSDRVALGHRDVLITFAALVAIPLLFERLGAYATLGIFMAALLVLVGRVAPVLAAVASAAAMGAAWAFFKVLLGLQLPPGQF